MSKEHIKDLALIVCTRNRPDRIQALLSYLRKCNPLPSLFIIVDSSEGTATEQLVREKTNFPTEIRFIKSLQGAPHQKNIGILHLRESDHRNQIRYLSFLDDDIQVKPDYFRRVRDVFTRVPSAVCVGGFDESISEQRSNLLRILTGLGSRVKSGRVLRSGIALTSRPKSQVEEVDWVPGGMQSFDLQKIGRSLFDGRIRIYGDEVEFQWRMRKFGKIVNSSLLGVIHHGEQSQKDSARQIEGYMDGFRWTLAKRYPEKVSKRWVIWSTFSLMTGEFLLAFVHPGGRHRLAFLGHVDFMVRLCLGKEVQQFVNHAGSGPFTDLRSQSHT